LFNEEGSMLFHEWVGVSASCVTEEKNFVELRASNMQYVFYVGSGGKDEAMCSWGTVILGCTS
jgi:hypothetical protein